MLKILLDFYYSPKIALPRMFNAILCGYSWYYAQMCTKNATKMISNCTIRGYWNNPMCAECSNRNYWSTYRKNWDTCFTMWYTSIISCHPIMLLSIYSALTFLD